MLPTQVGVREEELQQETHLYWGKNSYMIGHARET